MVKQLAARSNQGVDAAASGQAPCRAGIMTAVESLVGPLLPLFERERAAGRALALGVVLRTAGSTYRKAGALLLVAQDGNYAGLLSGGCLEGDLRDHARSVIDSGEPRTVTYDMRSPDDLLWGLGLGCEGAMQVLLIRVGPENGWQPLTHLAAAFAAHTPAAVGIVVESTRKDLPAGYAVLPDRPAGLSLQPALDEAARTGQVAWVDPDDGSCRIFILPLSLPPRILLLGAGPDAAPVVDFAHALGWKVTLADHRPAYAQAVNFPRAERVVLTRPEELRSAVDLKLFAAVVVMSHHLPSDLAYLRVLADTSIPYVGLLGPAARRERLLADLGSQVDSLRPRLRAPVGLALGGRAPESIALAIVAEIHAFLHGLDGRPLSNGR